jgi:Rod binding domain-containing protein
VNAAELPLDRLARNAQLSEADKLGEAGRQFEAILVRQILGNAMKPAFKSALSPQTAQSGIYQDMVVNQMADHVTRAGGLGLAKDLHRQLTHQLGSASSVKPSSAHD